MTESREDSRQRPGRPRNPQADRAILRATLKLLMEHGYGGMSVERVASEAGVGKNTIYRRYASKDELAAAAVGALTDEMDPTPDTGSARNDMVEMIIRNQVLLQRGPGFAMIGALLVEERRNPELFELFRERIMRPRRNEALMVLRRGVEHGEIRADADLEVAVHAIVGAMFMRHIMGEPESRESVEKTVALVWSGLTANSTR